MGRLLEGFGVGIISYVVSVIKLHPWLFSAHRRFMAWELEYLWCLSCTNEKKKNKINWDINIFETKWSIPMKLFLLAKQQQWKHGLVVTPNFDLWISWQVPVYIAEISPQNMRGALGSVNQVCLYSYTHNHLIYLWDWGKRLACLCGTHWALVHYTVVCNPWYHVCLFAWLVCSLEASCSNR
jgi:hypothetical protein